jgi:hypothetical protein
MEPITLDEALIELHRELKMRHEVYPRSRTVTKKVGDRRIAISQQPHPEEGWGMKSPDFI